MKQIKNIIKRVMNEAKATAAKFGDIQALWDISNKYKYATTPEERAALHIIIKHLRNNPEAAPHLPVLPNP